MLPQGIESLVHEIGTEHHLVVIQKDDGVMTKNRRHGQTHISNGSVAAQRYGLPYDVGGKLRHAVGYMRCLGVRHNQCIDRGVCRRDLFYASTHSRGRRGRTHNKDDNAWELAHLLERTQAAIKVRRRRIDIGSVVIPARRADAVLVCLPVRGNHDNGFHAGSVHRRACPSVSRGATRPACVLPRR